MDSLSRSLLTSVLSLPTMSFHEAAVATFVRFYAMGLGLPVREDRAGNLLVTYPPLCKGRGGRGRSPGVTFTAHMDHPGFEVIASTRPPRLRAAGSRGGQEGKKATVALWGKVAPTTFAGSKVVVYTAEGTFKGTIDKKILPFKHLERSCFTLMTDANVAKGDFGHYDLPAIRFQNDRIVTRAADNLVSVAAILDLMTRLVATRAKVNVTGLFTRGEEAGFLGAFAAMEGKFIPPHDPLIVLECSSAAGGNVAFGGGPAIRAGDLQSTYDPAVEVWMADVAVRLVGSSHESRARLPRQHGGQVTSHGFRFQRALLQGGRCEACVYVAEGYRTGGIALPLGNYHNQGPRGYAAEFVSQVDYDNFLRLITALAHHPMPPETLRSKVAPIWKHYRGLKRKFCASR